MIFSNSVDSWRFIVVPVTGFYPFGERSIISNSRNSPLAQALETALGEVADNGGHQGDCRAPPHLLMRSVLAGVMLAQQNAVAVRSLITYEIPVLKYIEFFRRIERDRRHPGVHVGLLQPHPAIGRLFRILIDDHNS